MAANGTRPLIELAGVGVTLGGKPVLEDIDWKMAPGEHWLITGPNGAGKSTLLRVIRGEQWIDHAGGRRVYRLKSDDDDVGSAKALIGYLSPELHERLLRMELPLTVRELIAGGLEGTLYLASGLSRAQRDRVESLAAALALSAILEEPMNELSFGQFRRALLARALIAAPRVLVLDEFGHGIDAQSKRLIHAALEKAAAGGAQLIVATHRTDDVPAPITHQLRVEAGRIVTQGKLQRSARSRGEARGAFPGTEDGRSGEGPLILRLRGVEVYQEGRPVLRGIDWEIRAGQHWLLAGPNGAGKSTLAKLLYGRLRVAHGGTIERFNSPENLSVSEIRRSVALISDDEQVRYDWSIPVESVVASGFAHSVGLIEPPSPEQLRAVAQLMFDFGLEHLAGRAFLELSFGERRMVLVARSLVRVPRMLILDEALNGFDREARARIVRRVERLAAEGTSVIVIGHDDADIPEWISNELRLEGGRIVSSGPRGKA